MGKANLFPDFKELFVSLNSAKVKYLVIGGYAVIYYGHRRATDDIDIWIMTDPDNLEKVSRVLQKWGGFRASQVAPRILRQPRKVFVFGREPVRVDLLTDPSGVSFESCYRRHHVAVLDGIKVPMISLEDLRANKKASGRTKDLADLEALTRPRKPRRRR